MGEGDERGKNSKENSESTEVEKAEEKKAEEENDGGFTMVMKMYLHCEGCARRVRRFIRKYNGVDEVKADRSGNQITLSGKMDGNKLKEELESKTKRKVEIVSPNPLPKKAEEKATKEKKPEKKKTVEKKKEELPEKVVVFKLRLHCEGCIHKIKHTILKIKGVQSVDVEAANDLVSVKGTMDVKTMPEYLKEKLRRGVELVSQNEPPAFAAAGEEAKNGGDNDKPKGGGEKKKDGDRGEEKKDDGKDDAEMKKDKDGDGGDKKPAEAEAPKVEAKKMEYSGLGYGYAIEYVYPPQLFSDENPNACCAM